MDPLDFVSQSRIVTKQKCEPWLADSKNNTARYCSRQNNKMADDFSMATGGRAADGMSGLNFDAFVSRQRNYHLDSDWAAKLQEKYWRARQKFLAKVERNEDSCIVLSDSKLDSKLEVYHSIDRSCARLTEILENYQNNLFVFANEENALGVLLKECGKHDQTKAGKIMTVTGKSLAQSSHQRIKLYMPLMRMYQEMDTFHSRAVQDTASTVDLLENKRSQYRASLLWMKDISEKLDPDVYRQLDKFRRVQAKVREDKKLFDRIQMDVVQKIDLLMASRCNLLNHILGPYQSTMLETFEKNSNNFNSTEQLIRREDIYEYEFKALKQLNPLRLGNQEDLSPAQEATTQDRAEQPAAEPMEQQAVDLLQIEDDEPPKSLEDSGENNNFDHINRNNIQDGVSNLKLISEELGGSCDSSQARDPIDEMFGHSSNDMPASKSSEIPAGPNKELIDLSIDNMDKLSKSHQTSRQVTDLNNLIEEPTSTLELLDTLFGKQDSNQEPAGKSSAKIEPRTIDDLLSNELDDIDNSSYFQSLQGLQI